MALPSLGQYAAALGGTGVVLGAFGAHALKSRLDADQQRAWATAVQYQLLHAVAAFAATGAARGADSAKSAGRLRTAARLWLGGATAFSGSIYLLCLGVGPRALLGPTTPLGGLVMIAGWAVAFAGAA